MEDNQRAEDINPSVEDTTGEDKHQCIKGEVRRGHRSICTRGVFYPRIPAGMGKYIPVQTNRGITGDVLIEINDKTVTGLILLEIVYNVKKKLGCIFKENHNSEQQELKRGQTIGLMTSCVVVQAE